MRGGEIARRALGGPNDDGRARYQIAVTRCDACGVAGIDAAGTSHAVDDVVDAMAACDAQVLPPRTERRPFCVVNAAA